MSSKEKKWANFFNKAARYTFNIYFYFYFVMSILIIILYYLNINTIFNILVYIMIGVYLFEMILGFDRNFIGILGIIIFGFVGYMVLKSISGIMLFITFAILFINILKILLNILLNYLINRHK